MSRRPALAALAERAGILPGFRDIEGRARRTSDETRVALLRAMRLEAETEKQARETLEALREAGRDSGMGDREWWPLRRYQSRSPIPESRPWRCTSLRERGVRRGFGILANLYSVRTARNWGVGDLTDLQALVRWAGEARASFVGVNPLHALRNDASGVSPYAPLTRLYDNPLYLAIERIPEFREDHSARAVLNAETREAIVEARAAAALDYARVMGLKRRALSVLYEVFAARHLGQATARGRAYRRYVTENGATLDRFATYLAIAEDHGPDWRSWPAPLRDVEGSGVGGFRRAREREIDAHRWAQFELDRQLDEAGRQAGRRLPIGLLTDLAVGCAPWGADPWSYPTLFAAGVTVGAPPDDYSVHGQDWGFPPIDPRRLAAQDFAYWTAVVRHAMRHAGAVRLDHAMGLYRQFWIPEGRTPADGAYVIYPARALFRVLAAESRRRGAIVIGEDLGTVPRGFATRLARWGVLSTRVLYFERTRTGYRPARRYSRRALVTATTHDHAPVAGFWEGSDLGLRRAAGNITSDGMLEHLQAERRRDRRWLVARLTRDGALEAADPLDAESVIRGAYRFLARTPAPLVGVMLDDLAAEREPVNLPGVPQERFPSWTRRMRRSLEELERDELAATVLADIRTVRGSR